MVGFTDAHVGQHVLGSVIATASAVMSRRISETWRRIAVNVSKQRRVLLRSSASFACRAALASFPFNALHEQHDKADADAAEDYRIRISNNIYAETRRLTTTTRSWSASASRRECRFHRCSRLYH